MHEPTEREWLEGLRSEDAEEFYLRRGTMDLDRLDEAIKQMELRGASVASQAADDGIGTDLVRVLAAARAYRDLLANGQRVEWCETHRVELKVTYVEGHDGPRECQDSHFFDGDCHIVSALLSAYPKEGT